MFQHSGSDLVEQLKKKTLFKIYFNLKEDTFT